MHIQCTKKMLDFLKPTLTVKNTDDDFFAWHADYLVVNRKKLFCLMNDLTRFCVVLYGVRLTDFKNDVFFFQRAVMFALMNQHYASPLIDAYLHRIEDITYGKTKDKKLVARLNRSTIDLSWFVEDELEVLYLEQPLLEKRLNNGPVGENQWKITYFPMDKMLEYLKMLQ